MRFLLAGLVLERATVVLIGAFLRVGFFLVAIFYISLRTYWYCLYGFYHLRSADTSFFCPMLKFVLNLLFPIECVGCGKLDKWLCEGCLGRVELRQSQVCPYCYAESEGGRVCCRQSELQSLLVMSDYREPLTELLHLLKYDGIKAAGGPLHLMMRRFLARSALPDGVLCPIPSSAAKRRLRGFNQTELLLGRLPWRQFLRRKHQPRAQMELSFKERKRNVANAFETLCAVPEKVVLFDDVATTLATLEECARVLRAAGAREVHAFSLARQRILD